MIEARDYSRKWRVLLAVALGVLLATIDSTILNVALPTLVRELDTTFPVVQWAVLGYLLTLATLTLMIGRLGDLLGKKRIYVTGFALFTLSSAVLGLAPSIGFIIGFRVVQALGAAMILALGAAVLTEAFPPHERGKALGYIGTTVSLGIVTGPALGGLLIDSLSWRSIFFVNVPLGVVATFVALRSVPNTKPLGKQRFDPMGALLLAVALASLSLALTLGQVRGFGSPPILGLFALAVVAGAAFVLTELRIEHPMVELRLLRNPVLAVSLVGGFLSFVAVSVFFVMPFYLEGVLGLDTRTTGLLLAVAPTLIGVAAPISGSLSDRVGVRPITLLGMVLLTIGYFVARGLDVDTTPLGFALVFLPVGLGMGIFHSPNNSAIMGSSPRHQLGLVSGLLSLNRILGQLTGIAVLGSLWAARVTARAGTAVSPQAAPAGAQVGGLRDILVLNVALLSIGTVVTAWGLRRERRAEVVMVPGEA
jgi:EmrB/QacA subfamily drug resistance transporter